MFGLSIGLTVLIVLMDICCARRVVDLTHTFGDDAPRYPTSSLDVKGNMTFFKTNTLLKKRYDNGMWIQLGTIEFYEHLGTHMDAPVHFGQGRQSLDQIPVERLVGPGVVIDVRKQAKANPDYAVSVDDIKRYERIYGKIPKNAIVMMNSGWAEKYPNTKLMFGTDDVSDKTSFHFPGYSLDACKMLLNERQVSVVGVDTTSTDPGQADDFYCHRYLQPNNVPLLEYVANLDSIPPSGTTIILGAMKTRDGSGAPLRILAFIEDDEDKDTRSKATHQMTSIVAVFVFVFLAKQF